MSIINNSNFTSGFSNYWNNIEEKSLGERLKIVNDIVANLDVLGKLNNGEKLSFGSDGKISRDANNWIRSIRGPLAKVTALFIETNSDDIRNLDGFVDSISGFISKYALPEEKINLMVTNLRYAITGLSKLQSLYEKENKIINSKLVSEVQKALNLTPCFKLLDANKNNSYYNYIINDLKTYGLSKSEIIEKIKFDLYSDPSFCPNNLDEILGKVINNLSSFYYDKEVICSIYAEGIVSGYFFTDEENKNNEQALIQFNNQLEEGLGLVFNSLSKHQFNLLKESNLFPITVALIENRNNKPVDDVQHQNLESKAATLIQSVFRRHLIAKRLLPRDLYQSYNAECEKIREGNSSMPRASAGKTSVYLPPNLPVVLKDNQSEGISRFNNQIQPLRDVLQRQGSKDLVLPRSRYCQGFLVEDRLPVNISQNYNIDIYSSNPELFDNAVRELTALFSEYYLSDLTGVRVGFISNDFKSLDIRYDNLPLFIVEEKGKLVGKIGLIDPEHLCKTGNNYTRPLQALGSIFPLHEEIIKEAARKHQMLCNDQDETIITKGAEVGRKYHQYTYLDFSNWLDEKNISQHSPIKISQDTIKNLETLVEKELLNPEKTEQFFWKVSLPNDLNTKEISCAVVKKIIEVIQSKIKANNEYLNFDQSDDPIPKHELVSLRKVHIKCSDINYAVQNLLRDYNIEDFSMATTLTYIFMEGLDRSGEVYNSKPTYGPDGNNFTNGHNAYRLQY